ncbi:uncharacterized protein EAE98_001430 [Botrytis deweyae]|uniref:C3H1-type domain-containing protein n=1 Tax=Botrytis deweyae TaxID=2478750 RepID=A0ABQ7IXU6_9HELO|nr:uncharacterized protein EAE98_001430 [Botrytis deweyae]KAF7937116.1 hypothetical protein EAE98_001430 [Botrytis deweyae]
MASWRGDTVGRGWQGGDGEDGSWRGRNKGSGGTGRQSSRKSFGSHVRGRGRGIGERGLGNPNRLDEICWSFQRTGKCSRGSRCRFSHEVSNADEVFQQPRSRPEETLDLQEARNTYSSWKYLIKSHPRPNDIRTIEMLWQGALKILDGEDRDNKQMVPQDLENDNFFGREHIRVLLGMTTHTNGAGTYVKLVQPFLSVMAHQALLDCLSIDTCVGNLYNFISGSNGSRAIPFFQTLITNLLEIHYSSSQASTDEIEKTLIAISTCLRELLRRERHALFHDDLPNLVTSLETSVAIIGVDRNSAAFAIIPSRIQEIQGMIARAKGLLYQEDQQQIDGVSTAVVSTYPREMTLPQGRHDNDKMDITSIRILPTEEEIRSEAVEFLPSTDVDQDHFLVDPAARLLDTHFRLLRHDIFGELKSVLGGLILSIEAEPSLLEKSRLNFANIRAHSYAKAQVAEITFNHRRGLEVQVSFSHPPQLAKKSKKDRGKWWEESKRLAEGVLLCLLSFNGTKCTPLFLTVTKKSTGPELDYNLISNESRAIVTAKLATGSSNDFESLTLLNSSSARGILVELPSVILATFTPILENLQDMQRLNRLPFRRWILPDRRQFGSSATLDIPPPLYARGLKFTYSLDSILQNRSKGHLLIKTSESSVDDAGLIDEIEQRTELDRGQSEALLAALLREFCHIQGPPGTGKSFLGVKLVKVLLSCKTARLGPIIIVCYTNHALDQFLEHLVQSGIEKVIRIGGQSKSKILDGKNLRVVSQGETTTKPESNTLRTSHLALENEENYVEKLLRRLNGLGDYPDWGSLKDYVARHYYKIYQQFDRIDEDGFEMVGGEPFDLWLRYNTEMEGQAPVFSETHTIDDLIEFANVNVHALYGNERIILVRHLAEEARKEVTNDLFESITRTMEHNQTIQNVYSDKDRRVLQGADIIGVTTTGLATKMSTLKHVKAKVIVCEEAGEVLEAHMLSALLPSVEHVISIGDHEQLRPSTNNYNLSLESQAGAPYKLDRSQFERLSVGDPGRLTLPVAQLNIQRRMRPDISKLIKTIYPRLVDHDVTKILADVVGMRKNTYWLDHTNFQDNANGDDADKKSHSNIWEVEMTAALVRHIVRQGIYSSSDIAVLTPYSGQLQKLRKHMGKEFEIVLSERDQEVLARDGFTTSDEKPDTPTSTSGDRKPLEKKNLSELLRIATVDNFQGEEAKVVIVSLVRSNKEKNVGFLRTTNRINVLLSRAQHGLYLIGNSDTYSSVAMWKHVLGMLRETNSVGNSFALCCPRHPETEIQVSEPDDFARWSPEGGCNLSCNKRLPDCGHQCTARCHSDSMHQAFRCPKPCERLHEPCGHSCQKNTCGEDCGLCHFKLDNIQLPCSHSKDGVSCHLTLDLNKIPCLVMLEREVPDCGHIVTVTCSRDVESPTFSCPTICGKILPCGHTCGSTCGQCCNKKDGEVIVTEHRPCKKPCSRAFGTCNHNCQRACHSGRECGLCSSNCEVQCSHSKCTLKCYEACAPCIELCTWSCKHEGTCKMPCAGPCDRLPCNKRCLLQLSCGHQCPGICGELCPRDYCQICSTKQDQRVDLLELKLYKEIDLEDTPIIALACGHFFTAESLDGLVGMSEVYEQNIHGDFTAIKETTSLASSIPQCPDCQCPLRQYATPRYNRVINRAVIDEMSKRFLVSGQVELLELERKILHLEKEFENSAPGLIQALEGTWGEINVSELLKDRDNKSRQLEKTVMRFCERFKDKHQPATKLHNAIITSKRQQPLENVLGGLSIAEGVGKSPRDRRIAFAGTGAMLKVQYLTLADRFPIAQKLRSRDSTIKISGGPPDQLAKPFFKSCLSYIESCRDESLPRLAVEGILYFAKIARLFDLYTRSIANPEAGGNKFPSQTEKAKSLLDEAKELCGEGFQSADSLLIAVETLIRHLGREWYEEVTKEELDAIRNAMVSGRGGIATHSGHWYECKKGHPFAIGECGMPMEEARCPECGSRIGGQRHDFVEGVVRSERMER